MTRPELQNTRKERERMNAPDLVRFPQSSEVDPSSPSSTANSARITDYSLPSTDDPLSDARSDITPPQEWLGTGSYQATSSIGIRTDTPPFDDIDLAAFFSYRSRSASDSSTYTIRSLPRVSMNTQDMITPTTTVEDEEALGLAFSETDLSSLPETPQPSRKRATTSTNDIPHQDSSHPHKRRRWNDPADNRRAQIFQGVISYLHDTHKVSMDWFITEILKAPHPTAARWRNRFKTTFVNIRTTDITSERASRWVDDVVRARLQATEYRAVVLQLRDELFKFAERLDKQVQEGIEILAQNPVDNSYQTTNTSKSDCPWRNRLLQPLGIKSLQDITDPERIKELTPTWYYIFSSTRRDFHTSKRAYPASTQQMYGSKNTQWIGSFVALLCAKLQPKKGGLLSRLTGMFVWSQGLSRLGLDFLFNMGICHSYDTINRTLHNAVSTHSEVLRQIGTNLNRVICYDNIQLKQGVRDISIGDESQFFSFTTGFVKIGQSIPQTGINRNQFKPQVRLSPLDILNIDTTQDRARNRFNQRLWKFYFASALQTVFPDIQIPATQAQQLPGASSSLTTIISDAITLQELLFDESTESGNIEIIRHIHLTQFALKDTASEWKDNLFLVFGDAMTAQRIQSMQASVSTNDSSFDQAQWILPIIGLWHLRYNYIDALVYYHFGGPHDDTSTLYHAWHASFTSRTINKKGFDQMHKLITNVFFAKLIGIVVQYIKQHESTLPSIQTLLHRSSSFESEVTDTTFPNSRTTEPITQNNTLKSWSMLSEMNHTQVSQWIQLLPAQIIGDIIKWGHSQIENALFDQEPPSSSPVEVDDEFRNNIRFLSNVLPYMALSDAIKTGNIKLLRYALVETLIIFCGIPNRPIYQYELCRLVWLTHTKATDKGLQEAILKESLVNTQGRADTWYEMDRFNELINFRLRSINNSRRTSSHTVQQLISRQLRTDDALTAMKHAIKRYFHIRQDNTHKVKDQMHLIWSLVHELHRGSSQHSSGVAQVPGRGSITSIDDFYACGIDNVERVIRKFNDTLNRRQAGESIEFDDNLEALGDIEIMTDLLEQPGDGGGVADSTDLSIQDFEQLMLARELRYTAGTTNNMEFLNLFQSDMPGLQATQPRLLQNRSRPDFDVGDEVRHGIQNTRPPDQPTMFMDSDEDNHTDLAIQEGYTEPETYNTGDSDALGLFSEEEIATISATHRIKDQDDDQDAHPGSEIDELYDLVDEYLSTSI